MDMLALIYVENEHVDVHVNKHGLHLHKDVGVAQESYALH